MKSIFFPLILISTITLSGCSKSIESSSKHYTTYRTEWGNITIKDSLLATVEGDKSSDLAFRSAGIISEITVEVGDTIKKWDILAVLGNRESAIQVGALRTIEWELQNLSNTTLDIKWWTEGIAEATAKLYNERIKSMDTQIKSLENSINKEKQNLSNQTGSLIKTLRTYANDIDRISTSMLYEWDRILGISTNFEYSNDWWENYLWTRIGNAKSQSENQWNTLYAQRGIVRSYIEKLDTWADATEMIDGISKAYLDMRTLVTDMNTMFHNSVVWGWLWQDRLDSWLKQWAGFGADVQQSEANFITWKNSILGLIRTTENDGTVAEKDLITLEFELENLKQWKETLIAERQAKLKEIQANIYTIDAKKWEVSLQIAETRMNASLASESTEYNIIRAPYDGIVLEKYSEVGMVAGAGVPVIRVTSNKSKLIKTYIDNNLYQYEIWSRVNIGLERDATVSYTGKVMLMQKQRDPLYNKNYTEIRIEWDITLWEKVQVLLERKKWTTENGILIPLSSIITRFGPPGIYILRDNKAVFQHIDILASDMWYAEVNWLTEWVEIIVDGKENIYDGELLQKGETRE